MNQQTGEIKLWNSLTEAEKASGEWIKLPSHDENGELVECRRKTLLDDMFPKFSQPKLRDGTPFVVEKRKGSFDALGRPR